MQFPVNHLNAQVFARDKYFNAPLTFCILYYTLYSVGQVVRYEVLVYELESGRRPFEEWVEDLDTKTQARIYARINRLKMGLLGDTKAVGDGLFELRCFFGPGYRIYFAISDGAIVVLLCGGDKSSQDSDIRFARKYWNDWKETKR